LFTSRRYENSGEAEKGRPTEAILTELIAGEFEELAG
jgi:hypothetical protein